MWICLRNDNAYHLREPNRIEIVYENLRLFSKNYTIFIVEYLDIFFCLLLNPNFFKSTNNPSLHKLWRRKKFSTFFVTAAYIHDTLMENILSNASVGSAFVAALQFFFKILYIVHSKYIYVLAKTWFSMINFLNNDRCRQQICSNTSLLFKYFSYHKLPTNVHTKLQSCLHAPSY